MKPAQPLPRKKREITGELCTDNENAIFFALLWEKVASECERDEGQERHESHIQQQPLRIFEVFLDAHEEGHGFAAVDQPVIVGKS